MILCIAFPFFMATLERVANGLRPDQPFVVVLSQKRGQKVLAASSQAMTAEILPGMPVRQAQALCPDMEIVAARMSVYAETAEEIIESLTQYADKVEHEPLPALRKGRTRLILPANAGGLVMYLDIGGAGAAERDLLVKGIRQLLSSAWKQHDVRFGIAEGKFAARVAAHSARYGVQFVEPGSDSRFLAPYPVTFLPLEDEIARRLKLLGISTLGMFAELPAGAVFTQFGRTGRFLHRLAQGIDERPVAQFKKRETVVARYLFDGPTADRATLLRILEETAQVVAKRLVDMGWSARTIRLTLQLESGGTKEWEQPLKRRTCDSRYLIRMLTPVIEALRLHASVSGIELSAYDLAQVEMKQLRLFAEPSMTEAVPTPVLEDLAGRYRETFFFPRVTAAAHWMPQRRFELTAAS